MPRYPSRQFKTELCRSYEMNVPCRYGVHCQFAHGEAELRQISRPANYKTKLCSSFHNDGFCSYGRRCTFIHDELTNLFLNIGLIPKTPNTTPSVTTPCYDSFDEFKNMDMATAYAVLLHSYHIRSGRNFASIPSPSFTNSSVSSISNVVQSHFHAGFNSN